MSSLPEMAIARQREPEAVRAGLAAWLGEPVGELTQPAAGGLSSETYLFESGGEQLVARLAPAGDALFPVYDLAAQGRIMQTLGAHNVVPVPQVIAYVDDPQWLGRGHDPAVSPPGVLDHRPAVPFGLQVGVFPGIERADWLRRPAERRVVRVDDNVGQDAHDAIGKSPRGELVEERLTEDVADPAL